MAPTFLTDNANNISYVEKKEGQIYSNWQNRWEKIDKDGVAKTEEYVIPCRNR